MKLKVTGKKKIKKITKEYFNDLEIYKSVNDLCFSKLDENNKTCLIKTLLIVILKEIITEINDSLKFDKFPVSEYS